jgi:hypothetical protein
MITLLIVAAAIAYLFWPAAGVTNPMPKIPSAEDLFRVSPIVPPAAPAAPAARDAIDSLLEVRDRLAATESLDEDSAKAVDVLWLDLLHGSTRK